MTPKPKLFFRFCRKCGGKFNPKGRDQKICENCHAYHPRTRIKDRILKEKEKRINLIITTEELKKTERFK
jgi:hypothetical protein